VAGDRVPWLSLALQRRPDRARFYIVDLTTADASWADLPEELGTLSPSFYRGFLSTRYPELLKRLEERVSARLEGLVDDGAELFFGDSRNSESARYKV